MAQYKSLLKSGQAAIKSILFTRMLHRQAVDIGLHQVVSPRSPLTPSPPSKVFSLRASKKIVHQVVCIRELKQRRMGTGLNISFFFSRCFLLCVRGICEPSSSRTKGVSSSCFFLQGKLGYLDLCPELRERGRYLVLCNIFSCNSFRKKKIFELITYHPHVGRDPQEGYKFTCYSQ